ncbi:AAA family ATPase [Nocardia rhizosphaerae]|uniref:Nuclease SbcCD subunit C n=1 Tax=Nocardia rhizosphaerae TaxID=1691571 RepID=A0ABV8LA02_9NOCA
MHDPGTDTMDLAPWVAEQLDSAALSDDVGLLILSALEGDDALDEFLGGSGRLSRPERALDAAGNEARGTFLTSVRVEGFRGIGPATTLDLRPEPGLTIVAGRNGSGKSSISEALEFALTASAFRWAGKKSTQWREQWRNLHHDTARIAVQLVEEGSEPVTVAIEWSDDESEVDRHRTRTQRRGEKMHDGRGDLGWDGPLQRFRPILSYDELGAMLNGTPSDLHDAISRVLGVEQLTTAINRIATRHRERKAPGDELGKLRRELAEAAAALDDPRAAAVAPLLKKTAPDIAKLRGLLHENETADGGRMARLRELTGLRSPVDVEGARAIAKRLREGVDLLVELGNTADQGRSATTHLLEQALAVHAEHGDMACPVCGTGALDATWAAAARESVAEDRARLTARTDARTFMELAHAEALRALTSPPALLDHCPVAELEPALATARTAWTHWAAITRGSEAPTMTQLATHLDTGVGPLCESIDALTAAATAHLAEAEDRWQPLNSRLHDWCTRWEAWLAAKPLIDQLAEAKKWLQDNDLRLRNARLAPIRDGVRHAWSVLRQESNVEISDLSLEGSANRRKLRIDSLIDGVAAGGLTVLSQGELHALALALFLPRATMAESPFRFLVLDDPVQAMDPAKVDGLVSLLSELARNRQVIVLSHDDRLPAAVRRGNYAATIMEVTRSKDSAVSITTLTDPARRYLDDARALVLECENAKLPPEAMRRTLPGMLRFAVETAAKHGYLSHNIQRGRSLTELETEWDRATTTRAKVALAVFGEPRENHALDQWARAEYQKAALRTVGPKMHDGLPVAVDPRLATRQVTQLVDDIERTAR